MPRKLTTEEFIEKAKAVHGDKYDYSLVDYKGSQTKVRIICKECNKEFTQIPNNHLMGQGCPDCAGNVKLTTKDFIEKAKAKYEDKYNYSKVDYKGAHTKVRVICKECGKEFLQSPDSHLRGAGCPYCAGNAKLTIEDFIEKAKAVHWDKYDYSLVEYKNNSIKVRIICNECGKEFLQSPDSHLRGAGCPDCAIKKAALSRSSNTKEFIEKAKAKHGDKYDYSLVDYKGANIKVRIICKECGKEFIQIPASHLNGNGCPDCAIKKAALSRSSNTKEFIEKAKAIHGDKYDYSLINYKDAKTKVRIICKECGKEFLQSPDSHLRGAGCPYCAGKYKTTEDFIKEAREVHGDKYDYSLVDYKNCETKVRILCKECGKGFTQTPASHLNGKGCPYCANKKVALRFSSNTEEFIKKAKSKYEDNYDYSKVEYKGSKIKVRIICKECGKEFLQSPDSHLRGAGCPYCAGNAKLTIEDFIEKAKAKHGDRYDYSLVDYKDARTKVRIICKKCKKEFTQRPNDHLRGYGCPRCNESHGEIKIGRILEKYNIKYEAQKRFNECRFKNPLPFDFYISSKNLAIEFDGIQHFEVVDYFGGKDRLKSQKKRDLIKDDFCKEMGIKLLRISYDDIDNIEDILKNNNVL